MFLAALLLAAPGATASAQETSDPATGPAASGPDYPLARPALSCMGRACGPFRLLDLDLLLSDAGRSRGGVRFQIDDSLVMGLLVADGERGVELRSDRLRLTVRERDDGSLDSTATWQGGRWGVRFRGERRTDAAGGGWEVSGGIDFRPSADLKLTVDGVRDLQSPIPLVFEPRPWGGGRIGVLWQRGAKFELGGGVGYTRFRSGLDERVESWSLDVGGVWLAGDWRGELAARLDDQRGRFDRRDVAAALAVDVRVAGHLLLSTGIEQTVELGVAERRREVSAGVGYYGRRYRFPRGGETGSAVLGLAREAWELGYGFDRVYDIDGLRDLRERLRLAGAARLRGSAARLLEAQVADRQVEQVGLRWSRTTRPEFAWTITDIRAALGIPWPLAWPWSTGEERVEFLRVEYRQVESDFGLGTLEITRRLALEARLHRELALRGEWGKRPRTPVEIALGLDNPDELAFGLRYAFGR